MLSKAWRRFRTGSGKPTASMNTALVLFGLAFLPTFPAGAQCANGICGFDECHSPAFAAPESLWGELEPTDLGQLPSARDNTNHDQAVFFGCGFPYFESLDVENGWLFVATNRGFQVWDATPGITARLPELRAHMCNDFAHQHPVPVFPTNNENAKFTFLDVDAPTGVDDVVATVLRNESGIVIWDTSSKTSPRVLYQDHAKNGSQVWATTIGKDHYAFAAFRGAGLYAYNMSRAETLSSTPCVEATPEAPNSSCAGVFRGPVGTMTGSGFVDGHSEPLANEHFVAFTGSTSSTAVALEVWDVKNPLNPRLKLSDTSEPFFGLALWKDSSDGDYYLALRSLIDSRIYRDVSSCLTTPAAACSLDDWSLVWSDAISSGLRKYVTYTESDGVPFLYFGANSQCATTATPERLFEISDPSNPRQLGSDAYWEYYYRTNHTSLPGPGDNRAGFNWIGPRMGKFNGAYLYRAGFGILDIHRWTTPGPAEPELRIEGPNEGFFDQAAAFEAIADNCSPDPIYDWTASGGGQIVGTGAVVAVTWPATSGAGIKTVTVTNDGCDEALGTTTIEIEDPTPQVGGVGIVPAAPVVCENIIFTAIDVAGQGPITYTWDVRDATGTVTGGSGTNLETFNWQTDATSVPGNYTAEVTVTNPVDAIGQSVSVDFELGPASLEIDSGPTYDGAPADPAAGTVQFRAETTGATEWRWSYGDGVIEIFTTREEGENPIHTYDALGDYQAELTITNCDGTSSVAATVDVTINQLDELEILQFQANCPFGLCHFQVGDTVTFRLLFDGEPTQFAYDWDGNGTFEETSSTPIATHVYTAQDSNFFPRVRISRGAESVTAVHPQALTVGASTPPSITLAGPASRQIGQAGRYTATASNCAPTANGWTWSASGGGQISGSGTRVDVTWNSPGAKTVTARNTACGTAVGSFNVTVASTGSPTVTISGPNTRQENQGGTYTASATNCTPAANGWTWTASGGGEISGNTSRNQVSIAWSAAGSKTVTARNTACGSAQGSRAVVVSTSGTLNANFSYTPTAPSVGDTVNFNGTLSTGNIGSYSWNFGDGGTAIGANVSHVFETAGTFEVSLSVGETGCTSPACFDDEVKTVTVSGPQEPVISVSGPPTLEAGQAGNFAAFASGCVPAANGWAWTASDNGEITGNASGSRVSIVWETAGTQSVTARNSACDDAEGITAVVVTGSPPDAPSNLQALALSSTEVVLTWDDNSDNETEFRIEQQSIGDFEEVESVPAGTTEWVIGGLEPATPYTFRIRARSGAGDSGYSNEAAAITLDECPENLLCIDDQPGDQRFKIGLQFETTQGGGLAGDAIAIPLTTVGVTRGGIFAFTDPANPEVLVKILDGCSFNERIWVFFAATTTVGFDLVVDDTVAGVQKVYSNPDLTTAETIADTIALETCAVGAEGDQRITKAVSEHRRRLAAKTITKATCGVDDTALCIDDQPGDQRFKATLHYRTAQAEGLEGDAIAIPLAPLGITKGGIMYFTDPTNPEVLLKVLNGCAINGYYWVFYGATTTVGFDLVVEDTLTGIQKVYGNVDGSAAAPLIDGLAFATCDP